MTERTHSKGMSDSAPLYALIIVCAAAGVVFAGIYFAIRLVFG